MRNFNFLNWIKSYKSAYVTGDLVAGLTVGVMLIPQGMAYAMLAGLPAIYGLYAATIPLIVYAFLGSSPQLAVGPVAMISLLVASGVGALAEIGSPLFIEYAILLALMVGVLQFSMGIFRLGFLVNLLSHPVIAGFTSAAALIIGVSQLKYLFGVNIHRGEFLETIAQLTSSLGSVQPITFAIGLTAIVLLILFKKWNPKIPGALIVVVLGVLVVQFFNLTEQGVAVVGEVPGGIPALTFPNTDWSAIQSLLPIALAISFVGFMESIAVAKAIQKKHKDYEVYPNQELMALGAANIFGSFFQSFAVTGGFSRTAVNDQAGAKSGLASIISAVLVILTLLFLTSYFQNLPSAILASIILVAVTGLIDFKEAKHLWKHDKQDFVLFIVTAIATLFLGVENGIITGVVLSLGLLIFRVSYPHIAVLGKVPGTSEYRNVDRFDNLEIDEDISIIRFDGRIYFANAESFRRNIKDHIKDHQKVKHILVDASSINGLDSTAVHMLKDLNDELKEDNRLLCFANVRGPIRDVMKQNHIIREDNAWRFFLSLDDGIKALKSGKIHEFSSYVMQSEEA